MTREWSMASGRVLDDIFIRSVSSGIQVRIPMAFMRGCRPSVGKSHHQGPISWITRKPGSGCECSGPRVTRKAPLRTHDTLRDTHETGAHSLPHINHIILQLLTLEFPGTSLAHLSRYEWP